MQKRGNQVARKRGRQPPDQPLPVRLPVDVIIRNELEKIASLPPTERASIQLSFYKLFDEAEKALDAILSPSSPIPISAFQYVGFREVSPRNSRAFVEKMSQLRPRHLHIVSSTAIVDAFFTRLQENDSLFDGLCSLFIYEQSRREFNGTLFWNYVSKLRFLRSLSLYEFQGGYPDVDYHGLVIPIKLQADNEDGPVVQISNLVQQDDQSFPFLMRQNADVLLEKYSPFRGVISRMHEFTIVNPNFKLRLISWLLVELLFNRFLKRLKILSNDHDFKEVWFSEYFLAMLRHVATLELVDIRDCPISYDMKKRISNAIRETRRPIKVIGLEMGNASQEDSTYSFLKESSELRTNHVEFIPSSIVFSLPSPAPLDMHPVVQEPIVVRRDPIFSNRTESPSRSPELISSPLALTFEESSGEVLFPESVAEMDLETVLSSDSDVETIDD